MVTIPLRVVVVAAQPQMTDAYIQGIITQANQSTFFLAAQIALGSPTIRRAPGTHNVGTALAVASDPDHHATMSDRAQHQAVDQLAGQGGKLLRLVLVREFVSGGAPLGPTDLLGFTAPKIVNGAGSPHVSPHASAGRMVIRTDLINSDTSGAGVRLGRFVQLLMHETGHAVGLTHDHERQPSNVMHHIVGEHHTQSDRAQQESARRGAQLLVR